LTIKGVFGFIAFMRLVRESLNDVSVDMNMDVTHAESYTHNRQTRRRKKGRKYTLQGNSRENIVDAVINKLTRLGRMGVVFATHSPADLNDLVIQLTNTKIAMRSEPKVLERVDTAKYAGAYAQSGVAVAKSFIYRTHAVAFKTLPPQTRHREL
jgi:methyl coenzyme M reductase beta subunit